MLRQECHDDSVILHRLSKSTYASNMYKAKTLLNKQEYIRSVELMLSNLRHIYYIKEFMDLMLNLDSLLSKIPTEQEQTIKSTIQKSGLIQQLRFWSRDYKMIPWAKKSTPRLQPILSSEYREDDRRIQSKINQSGEKLLENMVKHTFKDVLSILDVMICDCNQIMDVANVEDLGYVSPGELQRQKVTLIEIYKCIDKIIAASLKIIPEKYKLRDNNKIEIEGKIRQNIEKLWQYVTLQDMRELPELIAKLIVANLTTTNLVAALFFTQDYYIYHISTFDRDLKVLFTDIFSSREAVKLDLPKFKP